MALAVAGLRQDGTANTASTTPIDVVLSVSLGEKHGVVVTVSRQQTGLETKSNSQNRPGRQASPGTSRGGEKDGRDWRRGVEASNGNSDGHAAKRAVESLPLSQWTCGVHGTNAAGWELDHDAVVHAFTKCIHAGHTTAADRSTTRFQGRKSNTTIS